MAIEKPLNAEDAAHAPGIAIGGIGAGSVSVGPDGWFRNIAINNNRETGTRIARSEHSFAAVRLEHAEGVYWRRLQTRPIGSGEHTASGRDLLPRSHVCWRGLYPAAHYQLDDPACPARVVWSVFGPIIPFDQEASALPAFFVSMRVHNHSDAALRGACLFNWENLVGHTALQRPAAPAPILPAFVEDTDEHRMRSQPRTPPHRRGEESEPEATELMPSPNGLVFGEAKTPADNAGGQYCLAARVRPRTAVSVGTWDTEDARDAEDFWERFASTGNVRATSGAHARAGAAALSFSLEPGQQRRCDFVLAWRCPRYTVAGADQGNAYANRFANAHDIARDAFKFIEYYFKSVENWQQALLKSTLPAWLTRFVINASSIFSTNTLLTHNGAFALIDSPAYARTGTPESRLFASLATLVFFPRWEDTELAMLAAAGEEHGAFCVSLGAGCAHAPDLTPTNARVDAGILIVLTACRNVFFTGSLVRLKELLPGLERIVQAVLACDADGDGLPENATPVPIDGMATHGLDSPNCGLWVCALHAYARVLALAGKSSPAEQYEHLAQRAAGAFEQHFWDESLGHYWLWRDPRRSAAEHPAEARCCHSAQLAGQWYADFLGLGALFAPAHIARALDTMDAALAHPRLLHGAAAQNVLWPWPVLAQFVCLLMTRGKHERGLHLMEKLLRISERSPGQTFDPVEQWDLESACRRPQGAEQPAAALAAWHAYFAVLGLLYNVPERRLRIMPNHPAGRTLETPLFTSICLGHLRFHESAEGAYHQRLLARFDSPINIDWIELRVPAALRAPVVVCETPGGRVPIDFTLHPDGESQLLIVKPQRPISGVSAVSVRIGMTQDDVEKD